MDLSYQDIKFLPGVGPKKADLFNKELGIHSVEDLLRYYPYKYVDRSRFYYLHEINEEMPFIQVKGQIIRFEKVGEGHNQRLTAVFSDGKNTIELVWFKGVKYAMEKYHTKVDYVIFGKPSPFNGRFNIVHPEIEIASKMPPPEQMTYKKRRKGFAIKTSNI